MVAVLDNPLPLTGGIKLPDNRAISLERPLKKAKLPKLVTIPLCQAESENSLPIVNVGDSVLKGQVIAEDQLKNAVPVHASTSGIVIEITELTLSEGSGITSKCIVIEADGEDRWHEDKESIDDYDKLSPEEIIRKINQAGITISSDFYKVQDVSLLIINAAETESYISSHEAIIRTYIDEVITGVEILAYALQLDSCVITVEEDKSELISIIKNTLPEKTNIDLKLISSRYPASEEKQLIKSITGQELSFEALSIDAGVVVENISTAYAVKKAIINGEPLTSQVVTITGSGINQPCNLEVVLGTPVNEIIEQCGGYTDQFEFLVSGGPMTGLKLDNDQLPLTKSIHCLLAFTKSLIPDNIRKADTTDCNECEEVCPVNLKPHELYNHAIEQDEKALINSGLFNCIECGCCNYVCLNHLQLTQEFRQAKSIIRQQQYKRLVAEENKKRYLNKIARNEKQEKEKAKRRLKKISQDKDNDLKKKQDAIAAAVDRVRKKRVENNN